MVLLLFQAEQQPLLQLPPRPPAVDLQSSPPQHSLLQPSQRHPSHLVHPMLAQPSHLSQYLLLPLLLLLSASPPHAACQLQSEHEVADEEATCLSKEGEEHRGVRLLSLSLHQPPTCSSRVLPKLVRPRAALLRPSCSLLLLLLLHQPPTGGPDQVVDYLEEGHADGRRNSLVLQHRQLLPQSLAEEMPITPPLEGQHQVCPPLLPPRLRLHHLPRGLEHALDQVVAVKGRARRSKRRRDLAEKLLPDEPWDCLHGHKRQQRPSCHPPDHGVGVEEAAGDEDDERLQVSLILPHVEGGSELSKEDQDGLELWVKRRALAPLSPSLLLLRRRRQAGEEVGAEARVAEEELSCSEGLALMGPAHGAGEEDGEGKGRRVSDGPGGGAEAGDSRADGRREEGGHFFRQRRVQEYVPQDVKSVHPSSQHPSLVLEPLCHPSLLRLVDHSRRRLAVGSGEQEEHGSFEQRPLGVGQLGVKDGEDGEGQLGASADDGDVMIVEPFQESVQPLRGEEANFAALAPEELLAEALEAEPSFLDGAVV
eukprot:293482-Hanusia_phi.AAC.2